MRPKRWPTADTEPALKNADHIVPLHESPGTTKINVYLGGHPSTNDVVAYCNGIAPRTHIATTATIAAFA